MCVYYFDTNYWSTIFYYYFLKKKYYGITSIENHMYIVGIYNNVFNLIRRRYSPLTYGFQKLRDYRYM